ncbi:deoxyribose-phosphate aldolase [Leptogranulimonas caecicola]|jgi:deoxyribose-phosphate aldolase|uniref:Deoxyribose-phosphate aldolase n=2 Tax=Coriobacteriales TaxID=84999 RepID=A0A4S2F279_9ACTN|nr:MULTISPECIES: deoxyribose-phosphate aldolase [Atopobiaceae]MCI8675340.1 deoxyribose-phosphate aldolase [Atopobiaceae bacterium]TGY63048.1 deoxyribose-phosphate aldolase [Muricaecibacterium torontonense]BCV19560.1 deoxyribose-phosphate aldolase [Atopobiaceae bacterium P1]BDC90224.1 deoxyribose-phosphate aldolase [Leptogranulimonas caecicola]
MKLNGLIDHTILKATATRADIERLCDEAIEHNFASVCVNTCWVPLCAERLANSEVEVCCVVGFPLGAMATDPKAYEARWAVDNGADEVDMVLNVGWLLAGEDDAVRADIAAVVEAAQGRCVKVILETCYLNDEQIERACRLSVEAHATFVKTSTGFGTGGATVHDVALMTKAVNGAAKVKASGGIHTAEEAAAMVEAGADRIGTSSGIAIVAE